MVSRRSCSLNLALLEENKDTDNVGSFRQGDEAAQKCSRYEIKVVKTAEQSKNAMAAENDPALAELQLSSKSEASVSRQVSKLPSSSSDSEEEKKSEEMFD